MSHYTGVAPRLPVADLRRTVSFYCDMLGFAAELMWPVDAPTFAILGRDSVEVQFYASPDARERATGHASLSLEVSDARELHELLRGHVPVEWGPEVYWYGRREFAVRDPDGYLLIFSEPTEDPPTAVALQG